MLLDSGSLLISPPYLRKKYAHIREVVFRERENAFTVVVA